MAGPVRPNPLRPPPEIAADAVLRPGSKTAVPERERLKQLAAISAGKLVRDGMAVGLGTGSTMAYAVEYVGMQVGLGLDIVAVPTSEATAKLMEKYQIPRTDLSKHPVLDLVIDGADEVDPQLRLIKGGGGALTREKVVAKSALHFVVVADYHKQVKYLGSTFALPIEVIEFARPSLQHFLLSKGAQVSVRRHGDEVVLTDNGNPIVDAKWPAILEPEHLERDIEMFPGVVASGLFLGLAHEAHIATRTGVEVVRRGTPTKRKAPDTSSR